MFRPPSLAAVGSAVLNALFPSRCGLCGLLGPESLCEVCLTDFEPLDIVEAALVGSPLDSRFCAFRYRGRVAQAVRRLKYQRITSLAAPMSRLLAERTGALLGDLLVPVPIHWTRLNARGFNQSERLAEALRGAVHAPGVLERVRATRPQVGLDRAERLENLRGAFRATSDVKGRRVIVVDDVMTSGGTANECARALKEAGAKSVALVAFAGWGAEEPDWLAL